jgi:cytochrome b
MNTQNLQDTTKVWDLPLRIFHWLLVSGFFIAYFTEDELLPVHVWAGYIIFALLLFRLIWGFVGGNEYSQFRNFLCSPSQSFAYLKDLIALKSVRYLGHNPAGAAMIVLLLLSLLLTTLTGFAVYGADQGAGPLAFIGNTNEKTWEELHEFFANFTVLLVLVHILGVAVESYIHRESLPKAMLDGYKKRVTDSRTKNN